MAPGPIPPRRPCRWTGGSAGKIIGQFRSSSRSLRHTPFRGKYDCENHDLVWVEELVRRVEANVLAEEEMRFDGTSENLYIRQHVAGQAGVFDAARAKLADGLYRDGMRRDPFHLCCGLS